MASDIDSRNVQVDFAFAILENQPDLLSANTSQAIRTLAEASKLDISVRLRLASAQNLERLTKIVEHGVQTSDASVDSALRCIGNGCADNDAGRAAITQIGFAWANLCLVESNTDSRDEYSLLAAKVLNNICTDCEAAQQACYREKVYSGLMQFCASEYAQRNEDVVFAAELLLWICEQRANCGADALTERLTQDVLVQCIGLPKLYAQNTDIELFALLMETSLVFFRSSTVQAQVLESSLLGGLWDILVVLETRSSETDRDSEGNEEDVKILNGLSASLIWCMSDIAARPEFAKAYALDSLLMKQLFNTIRAGAASETSSTSDSRSMSITAACQIAGNLLWALPPDSYEYLVTVDGLHSPCFRLIVESRSSTSGSELLNALTGLLIHLTRPSITAKRVMVADENCHIALSTLTKHDLAPIQQGGIKLIKALGKDCPENQAQLGDLARDVLLSIQKSSEANVTEVDQA